MIACSIAQSQSILFLITFNNFHIASSEQLHKISLWRNWWTVIVFYLADRQYLAINQKRCKMGTWLTYYWRLIGTCMRHIEWRYFNDLGSPVTTPGKLIVASVSPLKTNHPWKGRGQGHLKFWGPNDTSGTADVIIEKFCTHVDYINS